MSQITEFKVEPLEGRWAEEAINIFKIERLLEIRNGQEDLLRRRADWLNLDGLFSIGDALDKVDDSTNGLISDASSWRAWTLSNITYCKMLYYTMTKSDEYI